MTPTEESALRTALIDLEGQEDFLNDINVILNDEETAPVIRALLAAGRNVEAAKLWWDIDFREGSPIAYPKTVYALCCEFEMDLTFAPYLGIDLEALAKAAEARDCPAGA